MNRPGSTQYLPRPPRRRTFSVRLLAYGLLFFGVMGWLRVGQTIPLWAVLQALGVWPGPLYLAVSGALWGTFSTVAAVGLWLGLRWSRKFTIFTGLFIAVTYWIDRLFLARSSAARAPLPFALILTIVLLVYAFTVLRSDPRFQAVSLTPADSKDFEHP